MTRQRIIANYIEGLPALILFSVISGLYFPVCAIIGVWGHLLGRIAYVIGYKMTPKARVFGFMTITALNMMMLGLSLASAIMYISP